MHSIYDNIEAFINGELEGATLQEFESALASDTALQEAVARHRDMIARLGALRLRQTVKKNMVRPSEGGASFTVSRRLLAAAASLVLVAAAVYFWLQTPKPVKPDIAGPAPVVPDTSAVVEMPPTPDSPPPGTARPASPAETLTKDNAVLIACAEAVQQMSEIDYTTMGADEKDPVIERQLNNAIRLLRDKKPAQAGALLDAVLKKNNALYREDAEWLYALSWLMRDPAKGKNLLKNIEQDPAHGYRSNAIGLLEKIE
ncbi:MAG: hypothetical protein DYG98_26615 [Haliscomenobacteraceae bacterium CHB4]|nr:hypothetical protein [Saprospiraceae bacterium]MCE7926631.1 hypothetical protein [Haliscomenobacteraceae bacterium CHB4]